MGAEPDLTALFAQEAGALLDRLGQGALELERAGGDEPELVASLFRAAHTLKGSAALVGEDGFSARAHELEDVLGEVRAGRRAPGPEIVDAILEAVDELRAAVPVPGPAAPKPSSPAGSAPPPPPPAGDPGALSVSVSRARLDRLVRLTGESRVARLRLEAALGPGWDQRPEAAEAMADLDRMLAELQRRTLQVRMVTLQQVAEPLERAVRDVARATGKQATLRLEGLHVELDRVVLEALREPLLHLLRNAVDHGIEPPAQREAAGKDPVGGVRVSAWRRGGDLVVEVADDGRGLDPARLRATLPDAAGLSDREVVERLFAPGVSTAREVTDVSGRGVGLDVVRSALARVRGTVRAEGAPGRGTTFVLTLPVTLEVLPCVVVRAGGERYAVPAGSVDVVADARSAPPGPAGRPSVWVGGDLVPAVELAEVVGAPPAPPGGHALVLPGQGRRVALRADEVLERRDLTVQELGGVLGRLELVAGASIDVDGSVLLVLDPAVLAVRAWARLGDEPAETGAPGPAGAGRTVLVVDDAAAVRALERAILERAGYRVTVAEDGEAALAAIERDPPDLVVTDVEMPRLDGLGLLRAMRAQAGDLPVLIVSSRADEADLRRGFEAGAVGYLAKEDLDEARFLDAVGRALGSGP